jgi:uncharacterized protein YciW
MCGHLKFACEVSNQSTPNQITLNQTMRSQTKACITKLCENCTLVRYYSGYSAPLSQGNQSLSASKVKKSKGQNKA